MVLIAMHLCLLGQIHALEVGREFTVTQNNATLIGTIAGFDGDNYLIVYKYAGGVYCQFTAPDGSLRGDPMKAGDSDAIAVYGAYGNGDYLVTWTDNNQHVLGRFASKSGGFKGAAFSINQTSHGKSLRGCCFGADEFLVIWEDKRGADDDMYGQIVSISGDLVGSEIPVSTAADDQRQGALCHDGARFLVAWYDYRNGINNKHVFGQFVDASGNLSGANFQISQTPAFDGMPPAVAFDGNNYLVVWNKKFDSENAEIWDLHARIVSTSGQFPKGGEFVVTDAFGVQNFPSVSFNGLNYLVTWMDGRSDEGIELMGQFVSREGTLNGDEITITGLDPAPSSEDQPYFADQIWSGEQYLTVYGRGDIEGFMDSGFATMVGDLTGRIVRPLANDADAAAVLKALCNILDDQRDSCVQADLTQDGKLGQEEALFALQAQDIRQTPAEPDFTLVLRSDGSRYASGTPFSMQTLPAGSPETIRVVNEHGLPPATPYSLMIHSSTGVVWRVEDIPAGLSDITLGELPSGATEISPFTNLTDNGTYLVAVTLEDSGIGDKQGGDMRWWQVTDGAPLGGRQMTVNLTNPQDIQVDGLVMFLFIDESNGQASFQSFDYASGSAVFQPYIPANDWIAVVSAENDAGGNGWLPFLEHELDDIYSFYLLKSDEVISAGFEVNLELGTTQVQGAVCFQDQYGNLQAPPEDAVVEVEVADYENLEGAYIPRNDGSFSGPLYYLKQLSDPPISLSLFEEVNVFRDTYRTGDCDHSSYRYGRVYLQDVSDLGSVHNPLVTFTAQTVDITVNGILGQDQWVCHDTQEVLNAANNKITGTVYTVPNGSDSLGLYFDRNKNSVVDDREHSVAPNIEQTTFDIPENLLIAKFEFEGFRWDRHDIIADNGWYVRWGGIGSSTSEGGFDTEGFDNYQSNPSLPTHFIFYQDTNGNRNVDSGEPAATLTNIPALTDRYCLDYPDVIQAGDFSPWP
ncbi:hypothetical protein [Desulfatibacillum alkenivorans]|uniref:hypothetical protein n=1 Tax=Desulfatibacillum alkenivorans TaxID=259354 RepID=UPI001481BFE0|nr:hypothetical protein [Desulfatibacillum alkenivorans]